MSRGAVVCNELEWSRGMRRVVVVWSRELVCDVMLSRDELKLSCGGVEGCVVVTWLGDEE